LRSSVNIGNDRLPVGGESDRDDVVFTGDSRAIEDAVGERWRDAHQDAVFEGFEALEVDSLI
jgi:hypothetical protein